MPTPLAGAFASVDAWLAGGNLLLIGESDGYFDRLREIASAARLKGPRLHDARIAALCLHHGVRELWSSRAQLNGLRTLLRILPNVLSATENSDILAA